MVRIELERTESLLKTPRWTKFGNPDPRSPFVFTSSNAVRTAYFVLSKKKKSRHKMIQLVVYKTVYAKKVR